MPPYNLQQQTFTMSILSNSVAGVAGSAWSLQEQLRAAVANSLVDPAYTRYIGTQWELAWGPVIYQSTFSDYADDAMMVVRGTSDDGSPVYVVAIAATNPVSAFAWLQDFAVFITVPFGPNARIAQGTQLGISILEALPDSTTLTTLAPFLTSVAAKNATLIFTGHSLGGTLAPTLALDLIGNSALDLSAWGAVYVYPTAGATPGDQPFANLFASTFPPRTTGSEAWSVWNANVRNTLDYVPLSWANLQAIPDLYMPDIDSLTVRLLVADMIADLELMGANIYAPLQSSPFPGVFKALPPSFCPFLMEEIYQHIEVYVRLITPELWPQFDSLFSVDLRTQHRLAAQALEAPHRRRGGFSHA